ncbi:MauE/DoxX family redox-associated membrane protein [Mucilaginibacter defluvii]|uniref:MauE/DoxX family redox-associated membrane protein n=1 Tax=Mucilaginibacter defluvii TaxID=1196019 RepID=UPI0031EA2795
MSTKAKYYLLEVFCLLLSALFIYTAVSKWADFNRYVEQVRNQPFPHWSFPLAIYGLPPVELLIGFMVLINRTRLIGLWTYFIVMLFFTVYVVLILMHVFGRVPCSCSGFINTLSWPQHLIFNGLVTMLAGISILINRQKATTGISTAIIT